MKVLIVLLCLICALVQDAHAQPAAPAGDQSIAWHAAVSPTDLDHADGDWRAVETTLDLPAILSDLDEARSRRWCGATRGIAKSVVDGLTREEQLLEDLAACVSQAASFSAEKTLDAASMLAGASRYEEALIALEGAGPGDLEGDALFLKGLCLERLGRCGDAAEAYGAYAAGGGLLGDYALLFAARCLESKGGTSAAVELLRRLITRWKHSPLRDEAAIDLCTYYLDLGWNRDCIDLARYVSGASASGSKRRTALFYMARAMVKEEMKREATSAYWRIVDEEPAHPKAGQSYRAFAALKKSMGEELSPREMYLGAGALRETGNLREAYGVLKKLVSRDDAGPYRQKGTVEMAALSYSRRQYSQAAGEYEALAESGAMDSDEARLYLGKALIRAGRSERAFEVLESVGKGQGGAVVRAEALWEIGRERESRGEIDLASESYHFIAENLPRTEPAAASSWRLGFCLYLQGDWSGALEAFDKARGAARADYQEAQALYWKAKTNLALGNAAEAEECLRLAASNGANVYYGARAAWVMESGFSELEVQSFTPTLSKGGATGSAVADSAVLGAAHPDSGHDPRGARDRASTGVAGYTAGVLGAIAADDAGASGMGVEDAPGSDQASPCDDPERGFPGRGVFPDDPDAAVDPSGWHLSRGIRLLVWGEDGWGALEFRKAVGLGFSKGKAIEALCFYGAYNQAMRMGGDLPPDHVSTPSEDDMYMKYPLAFAEDIWPRSTECGLDPLLALALIRQESRFNPGAVSYAGAYGLMQLMPATARRLSRQAGVRWRGARQTLDPAYNVRLGTLELRGLFDEFKSLPVVLSAYNAGPERAAQWSEAAAGRDLDSYIEMIGFRQTRDYVKLVIRDYLIYLRLYDSSWGPH